MKYYFEKRLIWFLTGFSIAALTIGKPLIQLNLTKYKVKPSYKKR